MKSPLLIENLHIGYGKKTVAKDLTLTLSKGEMVCLIGPNGAGKSTLLKTLASLIKPQAGNILLEGKEIDKLSPKELAHTISVVLTERVDSNLNVYNLVSMGRYPYTSWTGKLSEKDLTAIQWAIQATGLYDLAERPIYQLSDGERQKAMIAKALAQDTAIILLDEPTAHLDIPNRMELLALLRKLSREANKAILLSIHDLEAALQIADKIWLMDVSGKIDAGIPEDLILQSKIQDAFEGNGLHFDLEMGSFRLKIDASKKILVKGNGLEKVWTERALQRIGYEIADSFENTQAQVEVSPSNSLNTWSVKTKETERLCNSLEEVLIALRKL